MCAKISSLGHTFAAACVAVVCAVSGCAMLPVYMGPDLRHSEQPAEKTEITYRLDAGQLHVPLAAARVQGQSVSYDEVGGSVLPDQTVGTLKITFPHPDALTDCARIEMQIDSAAMPSVMQLDRQPDSKLPWYRRMSNPVPSPADAQHETWVMDISHTELDELLSVLSTPGRVTVAERGKTTGVTLATEFNHRRSQGACQRVPELDALMQKVRGSGRSVAYSRPMSARAQRLEQTSTVAALEKLHATDSVVASDPMHEQAAAPVAHITGLTATNADLSDRTVQLPASDAAPSRR